jgi:hypothetical protein
MVVFAGMTNASGEKNVDWLFGTEIVFSAAVLLALNTVLESTEFQPVS